MSELRQALKDYLDIRRALGFELRSPARCLRTFVAFLAEQDASHITTEIAVAGERRYRTRSFAHRSDTLELTALPGVSVAVDDLLPAVGG